MNHAARGRTTEKDEVMKTTMILATATAALLLTTSAGLTSEPLLSPRAKALADSLAMGPGTTVDLIDRSLKKGSPKHIAFMESLRRAPGMTEDVLVRHGMVVPPRLLANEPWRLGTLR
jgi:hypothetical protein